MHTDYIIKLIKCLCIKQYIKNHNNVINHNNVNHNSESFCITITLRMENGLIKVKISFYQKKNTINSFFNVYKLLESNKSNVTFFLLKFILLHYKSICIITH